ncbi:hypothetical protein [Rhodoferax antarcticus]|uniref:Uncharacterized protein n=1 Tax=Rhodoferax antarcticus ANT.BR TaxID=1111071 RepID=A0A1Q8YEB8_9BURK|nr:hypothetical protein [Rhodoferax antarcticus]APW46105.1 hypothetical protein RA876_06630 [Rhodoferax antarcticus]MCW2310329.1 Zn-finger protein [Rhodoferax antarcticus]OLP06269.1 hypothetical protein BLL52_2500 [Rhodoferax antarcticus ANT.BR]
MSYITWFLNHGEKHRKIVERLKKDGLSQDQIIDYFEFDNMVARELEFCLLYAEPRKCHNTAYLSCYMCACPYFRFDDKGTLNAEGILVKSHCAINSTKSAQFVHDGVAHLDCSKCKVPHTRDFVRNNFNENWLEMMKDCAPVKPDDPETGIPGVSK